MTNGARSNGPILGTLAGLAVLLLGVVPAKAESTPVTECGQVLSAPGQYHLTGNLGPCPGHGVVITASGVDLTLAGFTISGTARANGCDLEKATAGIWVQHADRPLSFVRVNGGTVTGFFDGILLAAVRSRVHAMTVTDSCFVGIGSIGAGNTIETSVSTGADYFGVYIASSGDTVRSNDLSGNASCGLSVADANRITIRDNIVRNNGREGVCVDGGRGHVIQGNDASGNLVGISVLGVGAIVRDNTSHRNAYVGIGVGAGSSANTLAGNTARSNGQADLADGNASCDANVWKRNSFATDLVASVPDGGPGTGCIQ